MWANTCWGLFGTAVALGLAMIGLPPEYAWLRPWFVCVAVLFFAISVMCFAWPLSQKLFGRSFGTQSIVKDWKTPVEAIEAFGDNSILEARDKWNAQLEGAVKAVRDAEDQISGIRTKFANVPFDTDEADALAAANDKLDAHVISRDIARDELRSILVELRGDIHKKLRNGELIAKGFRVPYSGLGESEIQQSEWRILEFDPIKAAASHLGNTIFTRNSYWKIGWAEMTNTAHSLFCLISLPPPTALFASQQSATAAPKMSSLLRLLYLNSNSATYSGRYFRLTL